MKIEFKILGPPELRVAGRENVTVSPQLWTVLVSLLLAPGMTVQPETLIRHLWGDDPPQKAKATIRSYIWRIDRVLSQAQAEDTPGTPATQEEHAIRVSRVTGGYALEIDPDAVDLHRFRSLKRKSDALADSGEAWHAADLLREAEAIWRGRPLAGLSGGDWIAAIRTTIEEEHRSATNRRIELDLALGRHAALPAELAVLVEQHPLDEELTAHQMLALFRTGRQADALRAYREMRTRLASLGLEPIPELTRLHLRILQHDPELAITPAYRRGGRDLQPSTLPPDIEDFLGRDEELRALTEELTSDGHPTLWVIEGTGGIGKTALAVHAAHRMAQRYPDAQLYLGFRTHDQHREPLAPIDALGELLTMLDVPAIRMPSTLQGRADLWCTELAGRRAVLVLDDVVGPEQVIPLLPDTTDSLIIVTSRDHPGWGEARRLALAVLSEDDAMELFTQVAGRTVHLESELAAKACQLCAYLPLAIRLAASRLRSGAVSNLSNLIDELDELGGPVPGRGPFGEVSERVRASFELSYRRLTAGQQRFFRCLGISPCLDITAHAGARLANVSLTESRAALAALADHHLLEETSQGRFSSHDLLRAFAAHHFKENDPPSEIRHGVGRLADYYLRTIRHANEVRHAGERGSPTAYDAELREIPFEDTPGAAAAWLESETANALRVAEQCAKHEYKQICADLAHSLGEFLEASGHWDDALTAHLMALQACRDIGDPAGTARAAFDLSEIYMRTGRTKAALQHANEAAATFGMLRDSLGRAAAFDRIGTIHCLTARYRDALAYHQEALDIYREAGDKNGTAKALINVGAALWYLGRLQEEMSCLHQAMEIFKENNDLRKQAALLNNIGTVQHHQGYHRDAMRSYQASREIFIQIGERQNLTVSDHNIAEVESYKGNYDVAITVFREVLATYRALGDPQHQAYALADIGGVYQNTQRFDEALAHYEKSAAMAEVADDRYAFADALCGMALAHFSSGRIDAALETYEQAARLAGEIETLYLKAKAYNGMAEIIIHTRGVDAARIYLREAYDIFSQIGVPEAATIGFRLQTLDGLSDLSTPSDHR